VNQDLLVRQDLLGQKVIVDLGEYEVLEDLLDGELKEKSELPDLKVWVTVN